MIRKATLGEQVQLLREDPQQFAQANTPTQPPHVKDKKPIEEEFPGLVEEVIRILSLNGTAAHKRRSNDVLEYMGTSLPVLCKHLLSTIPGLKYAL